MMASLSSSKLNKACKMCATLTIEIMSKKFIVLHKNQKKIKKKHFFVCVFDWLELLILWITNKIKKKEKNQNSHEIGNIRK